MIRLAILPGTVALASIVAWQCGYFELRRREHLIAIIRRAEGTAWAAFLYVLSYTLVVALGLPVTAFSIRASRAHPRCSSIVSRSCQKAPLCGMLGAAP